MSLADRDNRAKQLRTTDCIALFERDLRLALVEASGGRIGGAIEKVMLYCYHYDPNAKGYVLAATRVMRLGGALTLVALGSLLAVLWSRERRKERLVPAPA